MIKSIIKHLLPGRHKNTSNFFYLSSREQKKILKKAARESNRQQFELVNSFNQKAG